MTVHARERASRMALRRNDPLGRRIEARRRRPVLSALRSHATDGASPLRENLRLHDEDDISAPWSTHLGFVSSHMNGADEDACATSPMNWERRCDGPRVEGGFAVCGRVGLKI